MFINEGTGCMCVGRFQGRKWIGIVSKHLASSSKRKGVDDDPNLHYV